MKENNSNKATVLDMEEIKHILEKYKAQKGSLISILQAVQEIHNYIPQEAVQLIADELGLKPAKIMGVVTFYTQFRTEPIGKHLIMLCQGTACHVNGSTDIEAAIGLAMKPTANLPQRALRKFSRILSSAKGEPHENTSGRG